MAALAITTMLALTPTSPASGLAELDFAVEQACPDDELPRAGFLDTGVEPWAVDCLAWHGLTTGTTAITYSPGEPVTRGQAASFAVRTVEALEGVELPTGDTTFDDIAGSAHQDAIETLASLDPPVVSGFDDGTFRPHEPVNRAQFSTVITGTLDAVAAEVDGLEPLPATDVSFADTVGIAHEDSISRLAGVELVHGFPDGSFGPWRSITRGQVARMVARTVGGMVDAGLLDRPPSDPDPDLSTELDLTEVARGDAPVAGALGPDGRLYIAERSGTVRPLTDEGLGAPVVDIRGETTVDSERGLLGIAFAADASELYVSYTDTAGDSVVEAFPVRGTSVRDDQRRTVLTQAQPASNHNGGALVTGPDGMLWLGLGDGGGAGDPNGNGQDTSTRLGSLLRIDPLGAEPYRVPDDNPFVDEAGAADEIWAYGLRNPWRFSFDRANGELWVADVGQGSREEVNWLPAGEGAGANLGWNLMEGTLEFAGSEPDDHLPPVYEYDTHGEQGCAITGGYVYRGASIPKLRGVYLYADYCVGVVRGLILRDGEVVEQAELSIDGGQVVSFAEGPSGEVYVLDLGGGIHRIDPAGTS
ncbi:MAG: PQQ-dependent sugar dehydrogenase [Nitriliruptoraceae bacterium]